MVTNIIKLRKRDMLLLNCLYKHSSLRKQHGLQGCLVKAKTMDSGGFWSWPAGQSEAHKKKESAVLGQTPYLFSFVS